MIKAITTNLNHRARMPFKASEPQGTTNIEMPTPDRNYCVFDQQKVDYYVSQGEKSLPYLKNVLQDSNDEKEIIEALYIVDRLADKKTKGIPAMYPVLARFNNTNSTNIQVYLAGIYRKTQVPDAFGPLVAMLIKNSVTKETGNRKRVNEGTESPSPFDPNEEIGGAILEYIHQYSTGTPQIDYSA